ncbi:hypothetical protein [Streptomyces gardneri]|uniref:hypothetical protein n=1 Tax=Streptomyces gardneri TaxID=66892 RepID=UPI0035DA656C
MPEPTPADLSDRAAEAIRSLNHATLSHPNLGWVYPGDAYSTVANLYALARMLPQAISQIDSFIAGLNEDEHLRSDKGEADLPGRLVGLHLALADAAGQATALGRALDNAHQLLGPVAYKD